jgi:hypothetical protein
MQQKVTLLNPQYDKHYPVVVHFLDFIWWAFVRTRHSQYVRLFTEVARGNVGDSHHACRLDLGWCGTAKQ